MNVYSKESVNFKILSNFRIILSLLPLIVGQTLAFILSPGAFFSIFILFLFLILASKRLKGAVQLLVHFLIGGLSICIVMPVEENVSLNRVSLYVQVLNEPRRRGAGEIEFVGDIYDGKGVQFTRKLRAYFHGREMPSSNITIVKKASALKLLTTCVPLKKSLNPFLYENSLLRQGVSYKCKIHYAGRAENRKRHISSTTTDYISNILTRLGQNNEDTGLFLSMFLGRKDNLSEKTEAAFKRVGLTHILVVSGYQVTLLYYFLSGFVYWILSRDPRMFLFIQPRRIAELSGLLLSVFYVFMCNLEASVLRTGIAVSILVVGKISERGSGMLQAVLLTLWIVCLMHPGAFFEPGTQMTFAALFGICLGLKRGQSAFKQYLNSCLYASIFTSVLSLFWFGNLSLVSLILNPIFAAPISAIVCKGGILGVMLYICGLDSNGYLLQVLLLLLHYFKEFVIYCASAPLAAFSLGLWGKTFIIITVLLLILSKLRYRIHQDLSN
ncbi:MAG: ComEC/Rec2 family competence protein [SAR324 cluster bacterium]|uniref:ComEC/Rec2 family competence protein n=1 Tax=SAR324 cluster bacterium TaxID=2024889 RepID=A0A7X9FU66_9DELT|nr:ComEC/Rec2 family competence protein [SAR324 cluster bacterium]